MSKQFVRKLCAAQLAINFTSYRKGTASKLAVTKLQEFVAISTECVDIFSKLYNNKTVHCQFKK